MTTDDSAVSLDTREAAAYLGCSAALPTRFAARLAAGGPITQRRDKQRLRIGYNFHMSLPTPFHGARLKVKRAKEHIDDLYGRLRAFNAAGSYVVHIEHDTHTGDDFLKLETGQPVPEDFLLITGDAIHNLRTALDFVLNEIEFATTGTMTKYTKFPVFDTRDELEAAINGGLKVKAPKAILDFIMDVVQPYKGGNGDFIWALHALDIEDKHRLLIAKTQLTHIMGICAQDDRGEEFQIPSWLIVEPHIAPYRCVGHRNIKITNKGMAAYLVAFGQGMPMQGKLIPQVLNQFEEIVSGTLDGIERMLLACP